MRTIPAVTGDQNSGQNKAGSVLYGQHIDNKEFAKAGGSHQSDANEKGFYEQMLVAILHLEGALDTKGLQMYLERPIADPLSPRRFALNNTS